MVIYWDEIGEWVCILISVGDGLLMGWNRGIVVF